MKLIDVTVAFDAQLPTYPNKTAFTLEPIKPVARGDSSNVSTLHMSAHAGTHIDAPRHFFDEGVADDTLPLEILIGRARVIELTTRRGIAADDFAPHDLSEDVRVLNKTANSRFWGSPDFHTDYVGVTESGVRHLVEHGIKVAGVDYLSPAHRLLLGAGTIVIEGLNLRDVDPGIYDRYCLPLRVVGSDGAPARVVLRKG